MSFPSLSVFLQQTEATLLFVSCNTTNINFFFYSILLTIHVVQYSHTATIWDKILQPSSMPRTAKTRFLGEQAQKITSFLLLEIKHIFVQMAPQQSQPETTASARLFITCSNETSDDHRCA